MGTHQLRRITADWDFKNPFKIVFYLYRCFKLMNGYKGEQIIIKKSHSKGYHVFVWTKAYGKRFDLRKYIGDDPKHIYMDKKHKYGRQTLFHKKLNVRGQI